ncbi:MAG: carbohydrate kinase family protein [Anaerolineae bacterium]
MNSQADTAEVVCFGMITPAVVLVVDQLPEYNTGALIKQVSEFVSDDAAIVACLLRGWDVRSGLIGTALGDDPRGREVARRLKELGVLGRVRLSWRMKTPFEVNISDRMGARTYFWQRDPEVLATLDTADLSLLKGARLLYVDWYDGDHILRPMDEARRLGVPVFLNLEHGHQTPDILARYARRATICQAITDPAQRGGDPFAVIRQLLAAGVETALVTLAGDGCLAVRGGEMLRVWAPEVPVVDGCGAGAAFSAGFIYGHLRGWGLEKTVRFASAAASLKCTVAGPWAAPLTEIHRLAEEVTVERPVVTGI